MAVSRTAKAAKAATAVAPAGYLADTGIWVDVERGRLSAADLGGIVGEASVYISPVTIAELTQAAELPPQEHVRARRHATLQRLRSKVVLPIDEGTADVFGRVAALLVREGRGSPRHRVQDIWLAAQAIQHGLRFLTFNRKDFEDIAGLDAHFLQHRIS